MKPYYQDLHDTIYCMDFRRNDIPDESIQCVVTSPPYWGLRKYSGEQDLIWGGDKDCKHEWVTHHQSPKGGRNLPDNMPNTGGDRTQQLVDNPRFGVDTNFCSLCGAWKGAYGLEPTPEMYIEHTIEILREIRRVLRKDGVVFWNIGDSYSGGHRKSNPKQTISGDKDTGHEIAYTPSRDITSLTIKPKDLCGIPAKLEEAVKYPIVECQHCGEQTSLYFWAILNWKRFWCPKCEMECQIFPGLSKIVEDGWWVRSVIIWSKPNPMPESVTDRPTESHEYILMLTKTARYYWDADAVREKQLQQSIDRMTRSHLTDYDPNYPTQGPQNLHFGEKLSKEEAESMAGRNIRTVWEFPTQPYPEAHFAVFPEKLPEVCIKAATPEVGCCSKCGAPWERITKPTAEYEELLGKDWNIQEKDKAEGKIAGHHRKHNAPSVTAQYETLGWQPTCKCNADKVLSIVLDPFMGAGTTLWVAKKLNRRAVGYEISEEYCQLALERNRQQVMI